MGLGLESWKIYIVKTNTDWICSKCGKKIPIRSYCLRDDWKRICFKCIPKYFQDIEEYFHKIKKIVETDLKKKGDKYKNQNIIAQLKFDENKK